jgi:hypothetical protein
MLSGVRVTQEAIVAAQALVRSAARSGPSQRSSRSEARRQKIRQSA